MSTLVSSLSKKLGYQLSDQLSKQLSPILPFMAPHIDPEQLSDFYQHHVAAITGAGSGIGRELAINLASLGCHLALSDINSENLAETKTLLDDYKVEVTTTPLDVANQQAVYEWADQVMEQHGQVNFIFNNAGVALASTVEGETIQDIEWVMNVNFWGMVYGTKAFLPLIKQTVADSGGKLHGHIINTSSLFGIMAQPTQSAYNASKFAIRGFNESLRQELNILRCGVSLTSVHPGGIKTNIANSARRSESIGQLGLTGGTKGLESVNKMLKFDPNTAAKIMLMAAANNQSRCLVGDDAKVADIIQRLFPSNYGIVMHKFSRMTAKAKKRMRAKKIVDNSKATENS